MSIVKRLTAIVASGLALATTPEAQAWKTPSPLGPDRPTPSVPPPPPLADSNEPSNVVPPPSARKPRELMVFASGFALAALAAVAAVAIWMLPGANPSPVPEKPQTTVAPPQPAAPPSGQLSTCPTEPAATAATDKDGKFPLQAGVEGLIAADITSFIVIGTEAAAAGRPRDAEAAFLMACRVAEKLGGAGSVESADAKYQLGSHYTKLALGAGVADAGVAGVAGGSDRVDLLKRAEALYLDSLQTSIVHHGEAHEKSRLAAQGLATVRQMLAQGQNVPPAPAPVLAPPLVAGPAETKKLPEPAPPGTAAAPTVRPLPATGAEVTIRKDLPVVKKCPEAVAALGLCNPAN